MRVRSSLPLRLAPLWPALAALAVMTAMLAWQLPPLLRSTAGDQLLEILPAVDRALAPPATTGGRDALQRRVSRLAAGTSLRITVVAASGRVVADSDRTAAEVQRMESHAGRQEVRAALASGSGTAVRRSQTTQRRYVYAARAFSTPTGGARYVLRLAQPLDELALLGGELLVALAASSLATLVVLALLSLWLDRRLLRPLAELIGGATALAGADQRVHRLPVPAQQDLADLATAVNRITDRLAAERAALGAERDHLRVILGSMDEGVLVVDGTGRAVLANRAFRRLFGIAGEVDGRTPIELARRPELAEVIAAALDRPEPRHEEIELATSAGRRTVAISGAGLATGTKEAGGGAARQAGAVIVARDTTEAARLTRMRSDFVANVSHELKTPLSAIRGYSETLRDGAVDDRETALRFLDRILDQGRRLELLLADLLTLSRLESREAPREHRLLDLAPLVARAVETVAASAAGRDVELGLEPVPDLPPVEGDADHLEQMTLNLLDNAVKYNRPGGRVAVVLAPRENGSGVTLTIADTGIGIPPADLDRIFERFYRVDKGRARGEGGTGLGLAIVKHVAQSHGGRVEVESRPGEGSTFRVHLPAGRSVS